MSSAESTEAPATGNGGLDFVALPGGTFHFGCETQDTECKDPEKPGVDKNMKAFKIARTETTVAQYAQCVAAHKCTEPNTAAPNQDQCNWKVPGKESDPVNCLDQAQAKAFCAWAGARLPTAEEWEYAAKGGEHRIYPWGDEVPDFNRCRHGANNGTKPVGSYPQSATPQGVQDMAGNVWEWTAGMFDEKLTEVRGGSWRNGQSHLMRASNRGRRPGDDRADFIGFRCAK
jgi:formylglycine-generating enzyme required for sulfatase activity